MKQPIFAEPLKGRVEVDETYVGGKRRNGHDQPGKPGVDSHKTPVVSIVARSGEKRSMVMLRVTGANIRGAVYANVQDGSTIITDQNSVYMAVGKNFRRESVNHAKREYVCGDTHTNTVESSFSLLKRGIVGAFHHVSRKHLHPLHRRV